MKENQFSRHKSILYYITLYECFDEMHSFFFNFGSLLMTLYKKAEGVSVDCVLFQKQQDLFCPRYSTGVAVQTKFS